MSAFVVSREHIDLLVAVAIQGPRGRAVSPGNAWYGPSWDTDAEGPDVSLGGYRRATYEVADEIGRMLWLENVTSVAYRYSDSDDLPGPIGFEISDALAYTWRRPHYRMTAVEALKALACYEYQTCEHPGWPRSEAWRFCEALRHSLIHHLPGMDEAPWEWDAEKIRRALADV